VPIPRSHVAFGDPNLVYEFSGLTLPTKQWTPLIASTRDYVEKLTREKFNYVLINKYENGSQYIGYHSDDESTLDPLAPIVTLSLGEKRHLNLKHNRFPTVYVMTVPLEDASLLSMNFPTNRHYKHSILRSPVITKPRISLTFRRMLAQ